MHYTILSTEQVHDNLILYFTKAGNQYQTELYNKETKAFSYKKFNRIDDALQCYNFMVNILAYNQYTEEQKRKILNDFQPQE